MGTASVVGSKTVTDRIRADLCVIGAGSAGLSLAAGAVQMGASVILIEQSRMGGGMPEHRLRSLQGPAGGGGAGR